MRSAVTVVLALLLTTLLLPQSLASASGGKETSRPLTIRDLIRMRNIEEIAVSSSGRKIACSVSSADLKESVFKSHIYVVANGKAVPFTRSDEGEHLPRWSPAGDYLAFLSKRFPPKDEKEEKDGEEEPGDQIWVMAASGGEARKITQEEKGVSEFAWAADGKAIYYLAQELPPGPVEEYKKAQKEKKYDGKVRDKERLKVALHRVEIDREEKGGSEKKDESAEKDEGEEKDEILFHGDPGIEGLAISPDGGFAAFTSNLTGDPDDENKRNLFLLSLKEGTVRQLTKDEGCRPRIHWSADGRRVAYTRFSEPGFDFSRTDIFVTEIVGGSTTNLTGKYDMEVIDFCWAGKSGEVFFTGAKGAYTALYKIDPVHGKDRETGTLQAITKKEAHYTGFGASSDGKTIICAKEDSRDPPELYHLEGDGALKLLSAFNSHLHERSLAPQEVIRWKSADGVEIEGVLVKPHRYVPGKKYPLIAVIHGGPYSRVVNTLQDREFQLFAAEGYLVFAPNYRGSMGYGKQFAMEIRGAIMEKEFTDVMSGIDSLIASGMADPERIGITGGSYGGYMTNWALARSTRFKAGVSLYGISSLIGDLSNSAYPSFEKDYMGKWYWESMEPYLKASPLTYVQDLKAPLLLLHGDEDTNTYPSNSQEIYTALKKQGKKVELVQYPREEHGFDEPNHLIDAYERTLEWFDRYLKGGDGFHRTGSEIHHKGKTLRITSAKSVKEYSGITSKEQFIEIEAIVESKESSALVYSLNSARDVSILTDDGRRYYPAGIPSEMMGERVLLKGKEQSYRIVGKKESGRMALPIALTFEIPSKVYRFTLLVQDFPPVWLYIQEEEKSDR